jgi:hypothetical protein|tara:strand:- start:149 stop:862 length:714 start_codon:yes stop_codon:yes gene_type:complete
MEKQQLNRFVSKYNLAGLVESVKWESKDGSLTTSFISDDKSVLGSVTMQEFEGDNAEFGVYDTTKLSKMLSVLGNDVDFSISDIDGKSVSLKFKDKSTSVNYMLADLSVIPNVPDLKQLPNFNSEIKLDTSFISTFIKAKGALQDENNFTFTCKDNKGSIVLGHSNINTNRINIDVDCTCDGDVSPISFSATYLKEILVANKEATDATLKISSQGLAHISFSIDNYESNYYLVEIQS